MHVVGREAAHHRRRLSKEQWIVGANYSATDMVIFSVDSGIAARLEPARRREFERALFLPMERTTRRSRVGSPHRSAARLRTTYPPHWQPPH